MLSAIDPEALARQPEWGVQRAGYAHDAYAASFAEFGEPLRLPGHSWLLARRIGETAYRDAIGAYPFFAFADLPEAATAMLGMAHDIVSVALVPDPFSGASLAQMEAAFDVVVPYKRHYLVDLEVPFERYLHRHHRRYAARSRSLSAIEKSEDSSAFSAEWAKLYGCLVLRHQITGLRAFSEKALAGQLSVPGCHYFRALSGHCVTGALVCYLDRGVAYAHLVSTTLLGQKFMAQYALYWTAIEYFRGRARWFALGAAPDEGGSGLALFKRGWATATCQVYFCGKILNRKRYEELSRVLDAHSRDHFPTYRGGVYG